ncbi:MAG: hypothetical protein ACRCZF_25760, partial [Gemmataceae bacterium]
MHALILACLLPATVQPPRAAGVDDTVVNRIVEALADADPDVRQNLGAALARIGPGTVGPLVN